MIHDRKKFIGGSDAGVILGLSPFKTPYELWLEKTSDLPEIEDEGKTKFFKIRKCLEPFVVSTLIQEFNLDISYVNSRFYNDISLGKDCYDLPRESDFLTCEIDFEFIRDGKLLNGEIKTVNQFMSWQWGPSGSLDIPGYIEAQVMHGLLVTGRERCLISALIGLDEIRTYEIERDEQVISHLLAREIEFWAMVQSKTPPQPTNGNDIIKMFKKDNGGAVIASDDLRLKIDELKQLKNNIKALDKRKNDLEDSLKLEFKDASIMTDNAGNTLATWKTQQRRGIDQKLLKEKFPLAMERYSTVSESRVLLIK